jgi:hypothetical protein
LISDGATCPFVYCRAVVETVQERAAVPLTQGQYVTRIKPHDIAGDFSWWGPCPASLMTIPTSSEGHEALSLVRKSIDRAKVARDAADADTPPSSPTPRHSKAPRPRPSGPGEMFRSRTGDNPRGEAAPPPPVPLQLVPTEPPTGGSNVATVPEVRAGIIAGNRLVAEAQAAANELGGKLGEALVVLQATAEGSGHPLGIPQLAAAIELSTQVAALCHNVIEETTTYGATL